MDNTKLIPELRFPDFKEKWVKNKLENLSNKIQSGRDKNDENGNYPLYGSMGIIGKCIDYSYNGCYILVARVGANAGSINLVEDKFGLTDNTLIIESTKEVVIIFKYYLLIKEDLNRLIFGSGQPLITGGILKSLIIILPTLPEQQKIASFLTAVDKRIALLEQKKQQLEQYKKGVMQKLFSQELRFKPALSGVEGDENGNNYPDWEEKKLGEVFTRVTTKNIENNTNVLTISAQEGLINQEEYFNKSVSAKDVTGYYLIKKGDFAYNKSYSKGYPMGATKRLTRYDKGVVSTLYICFRIKTEESPEFYAQYFDSGFMNVELAKIAQEGARNHGLLNMSVVEYFNDIKIPNPCLEEQQKIANFLSSLDKKIAHTQTQIGKSKEFKKGLLQKMFV